MIAAVVDAVAGLRANGVRKIIGAVMGIVTREHAIKKTRIKIKVKHAFTEENVCLLAVPKANALVGLMVNGAR
jgi:hypothetical protein